jgi:Ras-related protein Rab-18
MDELNNHSPDEEYDHLFKVLLIGDSGVGKSCILLRFCDDTFDSKQQSTIGVDFKVKTIQSGGKTVKMTLWDTAGQERFRTLTSSYYRGAQGIVLAYDITRRETFDYLPQWLKEVDVYSPNGGKDVVKILVGNKIDMEDRVVSRKEGEEWARSKGMMYLECSAKTSVGISQVFEELSAKVLQNDRLLAGTRPRGRGGNGKNKRTANLKRATNNNDEAYGCC